MGEEANARNSTMKRFHICITPCENEHFPTVVPCYFQIVCWCDTSLSITGSMLYSYIVCQFTSSFTFGMGLFVVPFSFTLESDTGCIHLVFNNGITYLHRTTSAVAEDNAAVPPKRNRSRSPARAKSPGEL